MPSRRPPVRAVRADLLILWAFALAPVCLCAFTNPPRWGQASALVNDKLLVHGGKTDEFNSFSYTSAPTNNDLLLLDLSSGFDPSSPPWQYVAGSEEPTTSQGPQLAWHSLSAFNVSQLLLFGGDGGPNSPIVLPTQADSGSLLDVSNLTGPSWIPESPSWANEPIRRIHHSTSSTGGKIYIIGGEKDDGSNNGFSDHYVFDPNVPSFTQLPSNGGPPDIYGHTSVVLSDGRLLVFGGFSPSLTQLLPFSTIWSLDTTSSSPSWSNVSVANDNLPTPRRAFAAAWLSDDRVLVHGGADAELQTSFGDGWILDTSTNPMTWSNISTLSNIGPRRDHFAVQCGSDVLIGFGYETNGPASTSLFVFDPVQSTSVPSYSPPSSTSSLPVTLPAPSSTGGSGHTRPTGTGTTPGSTSPNSGSDPSDPNHEGGSSTTSGKGKAAVAVGTVVGLLGFAAAVVVVYIVYVRRSRSRQFHLLGDDAESPTAIHSGTSGFPWFNRGMGEKVQMSHGNGRAFLGLNIARRNPATVDGRQRVDMLADEDERDFEHLRALRERTGSSASWYSIRNLHERSYSAPDARPGLGSWFGGSMASLRSLGALLGNNGGVKRVSIREVDSRQAGEKDWLPLDPFADEHALVNGETASLNEITPARIRGGHMDDVRSNLTHSDPFEDSSRPDSFSPATFTSNIRRSGDLMSQDVPSLAGSSMSSLTKSSGPPSLPPLAIVSSQNNSAAESSGAGSNIDLEGQHDAGASHPLHPRPSSIIDTPTTAFQPVKRSDSWWSKFKRGPVREELAKSPSRPELEFRDPNPAPKLSAIHEASLSNSESPESAEKARDALGLYLAAGMRQSFTSLKTSKTADSETIERMAGNVAVMQRETTEVSGDYSSTGIRTPEASGSWSIESDQRRLFNSSGGSFFDNPIAQSPLEGVAELPPILESASSARSSPTKRLPEFDEWKTKTLRRLSQTGAVAQRVASYERRFTSDTPTEPLSPTTTLGSDDRRRRSHSVKYGLVQRPELFVANPDHHKAQSSGDSS